VTELPPFSRFPKPDRVTVDDGVELVYGVVGEGDRTPIVFANGWSCSDSYWAGILPPLRDAGHPCLVFDTRGHGESSADADDFTVPRLAADLLAVLDDAGVDKPVLVGHSMGVQTILEAWRQAPDRVSGLVPVAGSYGNPLRTFYGSSIAHYLFPLTALLGSTIPRWFTPVLRSLTRTTSFAHLGARLVRGAGPKVTQEGLEPYMLHLASRDPVVLLKAAAGMRDHTLEDELPRIDVPVLVVAGGKDTFTPPRCSAHMARTIPDAEAVWFGDAGHTLPIEEPDAIAEAIEDFITRRVEGADVELAG
jgi:pimeloyl-ACP methyl ester carboxylesterase